MLKKLRSVLKINVWQLLPLLLKAAVLGLLLYWASQSSGFLAYLLFFASAAFFYFKPAFESKKFLWPFLILIVYSLVIANFLNDSSFLIPAIFVFGLLFLLFLGVKNFFFISSRHRIFHFVVSVLYFMGASVFFLADKSDNLLFAVYSLVNFFAAFLLLKELLELFFADFPSKKRLLISGVFALLVFEGLWATALLPIGFLNSVALSLLFIFILEDFIIHHLKGNLSRKIVLSNITILMIFTLFIFATSRWLV